MKLKAILASALMALLLGGCATHGEQTRQDSSYTGKVTNVTIVTRTVSGLGHKFTVSKPNKASAGEKQQKEMHQKLQKVSTDIGSESFAYLKEAFAKRGVVISAPKRTKSVLVIDSVEMHSYCERSIQLDACSSDLFYKVGLVDVASKKVVWRTKIRLRTKINLQNRKELPAELADAIIEGLVKADLI